MVAFVIIFLKIFLYAVIHNYVYLVVIGDLCGSKRKDFCRCSIYDGISCRSCGDDRKAYEAVTALAVAVFYTQYESISFKLSLLAFIQVLELRSGSKWILNLTAPSGRS